MSALDPCDWNCCLNVRLARRQPMGRNFMSSVLGEILVMQFPPLQINWEKVYSRNYAYILTVDNRIAFKKPGVIASGLHSRRYVFLYDNFKPAAQTLQKTDFKCDDLKSMNRPRLCAPTIFDCDVHNYRFKVNLYGHRPAIDRLFCCSEIVECPMLLWATALDITPYQLCSKLQFHHPTIASKPLRGLAFQIIMTRGHDERQYVRYLYFSGQSSGLRELEPALAMAYNFEHEQTVSEQACLCYEHGCHFLIRCVKVVKVPPSPGDPDNNQISHAAIDTNSEREDLSRQQGVWLRAKAELEWSNSIVNPRNMLCPMPRTKEQHQTDAALQVLEEQLNQPGLRDTRFLRARSLLDIMKGVFKPELYRANIDLPPQLWVRKLYKPMLQYLRQQTMTPTGFLVLYKAWRGIGLAAATSTDEGSDTPPTSTSISEDWLDSLHPRIKSFSSEEQDRPDFTEDDVVKGGELEWTALTQMRYETLRAI